MAFQTLFSSISSRLNGRSKVSSAKSSTDPWLERVVHAYGDLIYDLCESVLWSPTAAPSAFRSILKELKQQKERNGYEAFERAWILRVASEKLRRLSGAQARKLTPSEQIMLDSTLNMSARFKQFDSYFHRLNTDEQMLLLFRDKYGIPYPEIAAALGLPEGSLKMRRQQALRA